MDPSDRIRVGEQERREGSNGIQLNSEVLSSIMCLYAYVPKIDASESLGIVQQNAADLRQWVKIYSESTQKKSDFI